MKNLFVYIVCFFALFNNLHAATAKEAQTNVLPDKLYTDAPQAQPLNHQSFGLTQTGIAFYEIGKYFYENYTSDDFADDEFIDKMRPFFPDDSDTELHQKLIWLRNYTAAHDFAKEIYNDYIKKKLTPHIYRKVRSEQDFDHDGEVSYIPATEGHFYKVYNFKKFLTYGNNEDEKLAIKEYQRDNKADSSFLSEFNRIIHSIEWKKIPLYGVKYKNPLLSDEGVSPLQQDKDVQIGIISRSIYIDKQKELDFGIHFITRPYTYILANNLSSDLLKPQIDLSASENVQDYKVLYPLPLNAGNFAYAHKYFGDFMILLKIMPQDVNQPIVVRAAVHFNVCNNFNTCTPKKFYLQQMLKPQGNEHFSNGYDNFFVQTESQIPAARSDAFRLSKFVVDEENNRQLLRLEFTTDEKVKSFKVFVEEKDGYTKFAAPMIRLQDNKIYVRILPENAEETYDLRNLEFIITAQLNRRYSLRSTYIADTTSNFDLQNAHLNLALLFFAFLGGLLLNFMPCIFPVISLKAAALSHAQQQEKNLLKQTLWQTIFGIFCGFTIIIIGLCGAKMLGYSLGWGMQFQSITFLVIMTFTLLCFLITLPFCNFGQAAQNFIGFSPKNTDFLIGILIVLLSTPCTGPYLSTVIGFALTGSYQDIIILLYAVAIGLSSPYWLLLCLQNPLSILPKPGKWMYGLQKFAQIMLCVAIGWFFLLIYNQTDGWFLSKFVLLLLLFGFIFYLYLRLLEYLSNITQKEYLPYLPKIRRTSTCILLIIFILLASLCSYMAQNAYHQNYQQQMQQRHTKIDKAEIAQKLAQGRSVLLEISADWCMTCNFNKYTVFTKQNLQYWHDAYKLDFIKVDWTNYNKEVLDFMSAYGRKGLPFYVLYTPFIRDGMVLPETFYYEDLDNILANSASR